MTWNRIAWASRAPRVVQARTGSLRRRCAGLHLESLEGRLSLSTFPAVPPQVQLNLDLLEGGTVVVVTSATPVGNGDGAEPAEHGPADLPHRQPRPHPRTQRSRAANTPAGRRMQFPLGVTDVHAASTARSPRPARRLVIDVTGTKPP